MTNIKLETPISKDKLKELKVGDRILLSGLIHTGRDAVHKYLYDGNDAPFELLNSIIYHCGPVVIKEKNEYIVKAAGPTTSIREEPYMADIIKKYSLAAVIGKGGMGQKTLDALKENSAVYLHAIGGAACVYAECVSKVLGKDLEQFGSPEAVWHLEVKDMPCIVTMDSCGNSLHKNIESESKKNLILDLEIN